MEKCQRNEKEKSKAKQIKRGKDFGFNKHRKKNTNREEKIP